MSQDLPVKQFEVDTLHAIDPYLESIAEVHANKIKNQVENGSSTPKWKYKLSSPNDPYRQNKSPRQAKTAPLKMSKLTDTNLRNVSTSYDQSGYNRDNDPKIRDSLIAASQKAPNPEVSICYPFVTTLLELILLLLLHRIFMIT
jgi:hypothetical protein